MGMGALSVCMSVYNMWAWWMWKLKESLLYFLELELQTVVGCHVELKLHLCKEQLVLLTCWVLSLATSWGIYKASKIYQVSENYENFINKSWDYFHDLVYSKGIKSAKRKKTAWRRPWKQRKPWGLECKWGEPPPCRSSWFLISDVWDI